MFVPVFRITNKILLNLIDIEVNSKLVELAVFTGDWEAKLKQETLVRRAVASLRESGNSMDQNSISKVVLDDPGRDDRAGEVASRVGVVAKERDVQQVLNWINANRLVEQVSYLSSRFKQVDFGDKDLRQINTLLGEKLVDPELLGKYRGKDLDNISGEVPRAVEVPYQMDDLLSWFRSADKEAIHPLMKASVMLYELLRIAPFAEGNWETAVDFFVLIMISEGLGHRQLIAIEEELFKSRDGWKKVFSETMEKEEDLTAWLEYISKQVRDASEKSKVKVMNLMGGAPLFKTESGRAVPLTERQIVIMEEMTVKNEMTIKEIRGLLPVVSDDTILRDLKDLIEKKLIRKKGKTKGAVYVLGKVKSFK